MGSRLVPAWHLSNEQYTKLRGNAQRFIQHRAMSLDPRVRDLRDLVFIDLPAQYLGLGCEWRTPPLLKNETTNYFFSPPVKPNDIIAFYGVACQDREPAVTRLTFGSRATKELASFELQKLYSHIGVINKLEAEEVDLKIMNALIRTEGYFTEPVVYSSGQHVVIDVTSCEDCAQGSGLILLAFVGRPVFPD